MEPTAPGAAERRGSSRWRWTDEQKKEHRINRNEEENAFGYSAHRDGLHQVGVWFERIGTLGRRRAVECLVGRRGQLAARAVGEGTVSRSGLWACPIMSAPGSHLGALARGGTSAGSGAPARLRA